MKSPVQIAAIFVIFAFSAIAHQKPPDTAEMSVCPMHAQNPSSQGQHHQGVAQRGDEVMRFSHEKTTHHFRLYPDGGAIEAEANDSKDAASRDQIRSHFERIVTMFAAGDFSAPMLIHAQHPPGSEIMKRLRNVIDYKVESTEKGARIHIKTKDSEALRAIHEFLRFQISDHQTGDPVEVTKVP
jgi:tRNA threonylcarbamoyladenosine modification (KEOPS) complex  Pcc1 subunit